MIRILLTLSLLIVAWALPAKAAVIAGPITNQVNGHIYYLLSTNRWTISEAEARILGGHLVTINDQEEQDWIMATFSRWGGQPRSLWIGLTDKDDEGNFTWVNGEPVTFTNWGQDEPNNTDENEHFVHIFEPEDHEGRGGTWNDSGDLLYFSDAEVHGVVEVDEATPIAPVATTIQRAVAIQWQSEVGIPYQVQWTAELTENPEWSSIGSAIIGDGSVKSFYDLAAPPEEVRFYRVVSAP